MIRGVMEMAKDPRDDDRRTRLKSYPECFREDTARRPTRLRLLL